MLAWAGFDRRKGTVKRNICNFFCLDKMASFPSRCCPALFVIEEKAQELSPRIPIVQLLCAIIGIQLNWKKNGTRYFSVETRPCNDIEIKLSVVLNLSTRRFCQACAKQLTLRILEICTCRYSKTSNREIAMKKCRKWSGNCFYLFMTDNHKSE